MDSLDFYNEVDLMQTNNQNQAIDSLYLPGTDSFINKFIVMYKDKSSSDFKNSLVVCLLKSFFARIVGEVDPIYYPNCNLLGKRGNYAHTLILPRAHPSKSYGSRTRD